MRANRRLFLASLASGALAACSSGSLPASDSSSSLRRTLGRAGKGAGTTTLTFDNRTATASKDIWFVYYGLDPVKGTPLYLADAAGKLTESASTDGHHTTDLAINVGSASSFAFPMLNAARLYISVGKPLALVVGPNGRPIPPRPADPKGVDAEMPWDFFELTYIPVGTNDLFNVNLSLVQSCNVPMDFHVKGTDPSNHAPVDIKNGWVAGGYTKFLSELKLHKNFETLIIDKTNRVLAPGTAIQAYEQHLIPSPLFSADYLKEYIDDVWTKFETTPLTFIGDPPPNSNEFVTFTGQVSKGLFTFTPGSNPLGLEPIVLNKATTAEIMEDTILTWCNSGCTGVNQQNYLNQICGTFFAAFHRSMMLKTTILANSSDGQWCKDDAEFYKDKTTDYYAKYIHANSIGGRAYAFQSDDHCSVSSFVSVNNPEFFRITLLAS